MTKRLRIYLHPDGRIEAETVGIKGKACVEYIDLLEQMLDAVTVESSYTADYYHQSNWDWSREGVRQSLKES
jgi:hypothetical protein